MKGTITVNDDISSNINSKENNATFDTVALLMVPTKDLDKHISTIESEGVDVVDYLCSKTCGMARKELRPNRHCLCSEGAKTLKSVDSSLLWKV